jgi:hypothetical protein
MTRGGAERAGRLLHGNEHWMLFGYIDKLMKILYICLRSDRSPDDSGVGRFALRV